MEQYYIDFLNLLEKEDRYGCIKYAQELLKQKKLCVVDLYEKIIAPAIQNITCKLNEKSMCIWQEHVRSSIVKSVIENCYIYVAEEANKNSDLEKKEKVVVLCPEGEYHDIGARMISDFFVILGYDAIFVGSDTPKSDFLAAINHIKPKYAVISVTNYYNLVAAKKAIENIKNTTTEEVKIIVGGNAFKSNRGTYIKIGADILINDFKDIENLGGV